MMVGSIVEEEDGVFEVVDLEVIEGDDGSTVSRIKMRLIED